MTQQLGHFFLNVNDDVGLLQFFLQTLIVPAQLFVFGCQRIPLRLRTSFLRKGLAHGAIALFAPAVQSRGIDPFSSQNGADTAAIYQGTIRLFQNPPFLLSGKDPPLRFGWNFGIGRTDYERNCNLGFAHNVSPCRPAL